MHSRHQIRIVLLAGLVGAVFLAHGLSVLAPLQFDDEHQITNNPAMQQWNSIPQFFVDPWMGSVLGHIRFYRPILFTTFVIDYHLGGGSAIPYRVSSMVLLIAFALLVTAFAKRILARLCPAWSSSRVESIAVLSATLAVVHPLFNESLLLATGRSSLLMAVFGLGALVLLVPATAAGSRSVVVLGLAVLALLTKESAVVLAPLALLVTLVLNRPVPLPQRLLPSLPVIIPVIAYLVFYFGFDQLGNMAAEPHATAPRAFWATEAQTLTDRIGAGAVAFLGLARLFLLPVDMSLVHEIEPITGVGKLAATLVWPALFLTGAYFLVRGKDLGRVFGFALLWVIAALFPILTAKLNTPMAEHRVVLSLAVPLIWSASFVCTLKSNAVRNAVASTAVLILALLAAWHSWQWRDPVNHWTYETRQYPQSQRAWSFLAAALQQTEQFDRASEILNRMTTNSTDNPQILQQLAFLELARGDYARAEASAIRALEEETELPNLHLLLAERYSLTGRLEQAHHHAREAVRISPRNSAAWNGLGNVLMLAGDPESIIAYQRAVRIDPNNPEASQNLALARQHFAQPRL